MSLKKGGVYAAQLDNGSYFYVYYITTGCVGDLVKVSSYTSNDIDLDVGKIIAEPSLYDDEYIIAFLDHDLERLKLVDCVRVDFKGFMDKSFITKSSIKCGMIKESFNGDIEELKKRYLSGEKYFCDDWVLEEHKVIGARGKFDIVNEYQIGKLPEKYLNSFNSMIFPHLDDFSHKITEGFDRNTMLCNVYR